MSIKLVFNNSFLKNKGVALFVSILMSMSLAAIAVASMNRLTEAANTAGRTLQDRRLLIYAQSASNIVCAEIQERLDENLVPEFQYFISNGGTSFRLYPKDDSTSSNRVLFAYRAEAYQFASAADSPPGFANNIQVPDSGVCYDIVVDVAEVISMPDGYVDAESSNRLGSGFYLGKMKTVGMISCFRKGSGT